MSPRKLSKCKNDLKKRSVTNQIRASFVCLVVIVGFCRVANHQANVQPVPFESNLKREVQPTEILKLTFRFVTRGLDTGESLECSLSKLLYAEDCVYGLKILVEHWTVWFVNNQEVKCCGAPTFSNRFQNYFAHCKPGPLNSVTAF